MEDSSQIKDQLKKKLEKITKTLEVGKLLVTGNGGGQIELKTDFDVKKFGYSAGQFVRRVTCSCGCQTSIGLVVGVGKGCPKNPDNEDLWFLWERDRGISHYCESTAKDFEKHGFVLLD